MYTSLRCKKRKQESREDYRYSGSDNDEEEPQVAGEPSSMIPATGGDTLRRNFQQIQEGRVAAQNLELQQQQLAQQHAPQPNRNQKQVQQQPSRDKPPTEEPPRPALPQRLIVVPDPHQQAAQPQQMPIQHAANRPLPPTPRSSNGSSGSSSQVQQQQPQRNSQQFKPMVDSPVVVASSLTSLFV